MRNLDFSIHIIESALRKCIRWRKFSSQYIYMIKSMDIDTDMCGCECVFY